MRTHLQDIWKHHSSVMLGAAVALVTAAPPTDLLAQTAGPSSASGDQVPSGDADWISEAVPEYFINFKLLDVSLWQWIALFVLIGIVFVLGFLIARIIFRIFHALAQRSATTWDEILLEKTIGPLRLAASVVLFFFGSIALRLPEQGDAAVAAVCTFLIVLAAAWLLTRLIDLFCAYVEERLDAKGDAATKTLVPLGRRVTKVFVFVLAGLSLMQNLGFNIGGLLAGLGIGGLAIALAAQKTLENLFGGFVLVADRPVKIGDFCRIGEHMGTIEDIGLRSSRVRTLDRTVVSVPNAELSTVRIENYGVRDKMRLYTILQVGYDTSPDQMRYLLVEIRRMLYAHPRTLPDPCRVRFLNLGAYSLDIEVFVFVDTQNWQEFTGIREDIYLRIMDIVEASGAYFAYPSQTLYLGRDGGRDMDRTATAEASVNAWRSDNALPMPEFSEEMIANIDDTLDYPTKGSLRRDPSGGPGKHLADDGHQPV